jgi:hypothetical protein
MKLSNSVARPNSRGSPPRPKQIAHKIDDLPVPFGPTTIFNLSERKKRVAEK